MCNMMDYLILCLWFAAQALRKKDGELYHLNLDSRAEQKRSKHKTDERALPFVQFI